MREQYEEITRLASLPNVSVQVLPQTLRGYLSVHPYSDSTFRHGFEVRELTDLHEACLRLDPHTLQPAAERALQVLFRLS
ncbi:Scr1 family TA system antitoxin-like transcriptional regulator [Streptomyces scabichelini]|uniref:Scr1 family TA system antitoxin-like transcriptional regulator n=1 Tax=Streptomyces scabichelini TaxID=2711217 RepID=UPI001F497912|nr:Scr1 family TA system antitoxin-like transcriptional regulator [Streptomyces scabichelini]